MCVHHVYGIPVEVWERGDQVKQRLRTLDAAKNKSVLLSQVAEISLSIAQKKLMLRSVATQVAGNFCLFQ